MIQLFIEATFWLCFDSILWITRRRITKRRTARLVAAFHRGETIRIPCMAGFLGEGLEKRSRVLIVSHGEVRIADRWRTGSGDVISPSAVTVDQCSERSAIMTCDVGNSRLEIVLPTQEQTLVEIITRAVRGQG
ncbi:hypothetical protein [Streptomyces sp. NBC_00503]|uniref:hypothetical protein n=1 Tax=Streptomyces sp. NBC_00503 TaxID=2903659 RepID=UPI002E820CA2|nr:hypothetical protein [Streptomyces sp. NBC_00503]WUD85680.1 hypothetical protein OG490_36855 [Streptomyces sp. NBC_00503]